MDACLSRCFLGIGNGEYAMQPLQHAVQSAESVGDAFRELGYEVLQYPNVKDREAWEAAISGLKASVHFATSVIVLYFAGHGVTAKDNTHRLLFQDADSTVGGNDDLSISVSDVLTDLMSLPTRNDAFVLLLLDSCRTHGGQSSPKDLASVKAFQKFNRSYGVIYATAVGRSAIDGVGSEISPFAQSLCFRVPQQKSLSETYNAMHRDVVSYSKNLNYFKQELQWVGNGHLEQSVFQSPASSNDSMVSTTNVPYTAESASVDTGLSSRASLQVMGHRLQWSILFFVAIVAAVVVAACLLLWLVPRTSECRLGPWFDDGPCSKTCGVGTRLQRRNVTVPAAHGGHCRNLSSATGFPV